MWAVFSKETESQEVKAHALRPLRELLKLRPPSLAADTWDVSLSFTFFIFRAATAACAGVVVVRSSAPERSMIRCIQTAACILGENIKAHLRNILP